MNGATTTAKSPFDGIRVALASADCWRSPSVW